MLRATVLALGLLLASQSFAADLPDGAFAQLGGSAFRHPDKPTALAYRPDGEHLASGGADGCVRIWDKAGTEVTVLKVKDGHASILAYSPDGKRLLAQFSDEKVRIYDVAKDYAQLRTVAIKNLETLSFTDDLKYLAGCTTGGQLLVVETATGLDRMEIPEGKAIAIAPEGSVVASANTLHVVNIYEVPSGKPLAQFLPPKGEKIAVTGIVFSADSKRIAVATEGPSASQVRIFDLKKKDPLLTVDGETPMAFCGDNKLALRQATGLALYDLGTSKRLHLLGDKFTALAITADGAKAATDNATGFATARIRIWDLKDGAEQFAKTDPVVGLRGMVATGSKDKYWVIEQKGFSVWSPDQAPVLLSKQDKPIVAFARSKNGFYYSDGFRVRNTPMTDSDASHTHERSLYPEGVRHLAVAADDSMVAAAVSGDKPKLLIGTDDLDKLKLTITLPSQALGVAIHPQKKSVAVVGRDGLLRVWDPAGSDKGPELWKARIARSLKANVAYSPDGSLIAVTSVVRVSLFDSKTGDPVANMERQWEDGPFTSVIFSPVGRLLIAGTQGTFGSVVVWELATGLMVKRFIGSRGSIAHLGISPDGQTLSTIAADDTALLWDITGRRGKPAPTEKQLKSAWVQLGIPDAEIAWPAVELLRAGGDTVLPIAKVGIEEAQASIKKIDQLVGVLGSADFATREAASKDLAVIGAPALPALKAAEAKTTNAEARDRIEKLLAKIRSAGEKLPDSGLVGEPLRLLRAVAVLEPLKGDIATTRLEEIKTLGGPAGAAAEKVLKARK